MKQIKNYFTGRKAMIEYSVDMNDVYTNIDY